MMIFYRRLHPTPLGELTLLATGQGLSAVLWENDNPRRVGQINRIDGGRSAILDAACCQLDEYFAARRRVFTLPLDFYGTEFQKQVWQALLTIPFGQTRSYGELAAQIGRPGAMRAVGAANGRNPISIITPCHRVIGRDGKLTGFAGGMEAKAWLLRHEGHTRF